MTHHTDAERAEFQDGAWYWVEKEGWIGEPPTIAPACYKAGSDAWHSVAFSGIPTRELKVLGPCRRAPTAPQAVQAAVPVDVEVLRTVITRAISSKTSHHITAAKAVFTRDHQSGTALGELVDAIAEDLGLHFAATQPAAQAVRDAVSEADAFAQLVCPRHAMRGPSGALEFFHDLGDAMREVWLAGIKYGAAHPAEGVPTSEREEFERVVNATMHDAGEDHVAERLARWPDGAYKDRSTGYAWWGWQARGALTATQPAAPQAAVLDGWKPVPIKVPDSAFAWVSGGYPAGFKAGDKRDTAVVHERAQRTWEAILNGITAPAHPAEGVPELHREWRSAFQEAIETMEAEIDSRSDAENVRRMKRATSVLQSMLATTPAAPGAYSLDADPAGIRARAAEAITGALAFGAQNGNAPPSGHWLEPFWTMAHAERTQRGATPAVCASDARGIVQARIESVRKQNPGRGGRVNAGVAFALDLLEQVLGDLSAAQPAAQAVPVLYVSKGQLDSHRDPDGDDTDGAGRYIPARKTPKGNFTAPLYEHPAPAVQGMTEAARSVLAERARQISAEGYTPEQDDGYNPGVLALHGGLYACHAYDNLTKKRAPEGWQWDAKWWKSKDPRSNLVKAGALILAELERVDRSYAAQAKQRGA